jgi:hypothetical protein
MLIYLVNKVLMITLIMCILNIFKHIWGVINILREQDLPNKYIISKLELFLLGLSISYTITIILNGLQY